ncbi:TPA: hypothetical protein ACH3X2_001642 [Trebouxia sp. C0005]
MYCPWWNCSWAEPARSAPMQPMYRPIRERYVAGNCKIRLGRSKTEEEQRNLQQPGQVAPYSVTKSKNSPAQIRCLVTPTKVQPVQATALGNMPPYAGTSIRDRTAELTSIADRLQRQQASAFRERAALVGKGIQSTSQKLHQLTQLAKRTSMFDDPAQEINELTMVLKQDIQGLNIQIADLQNMHGAALDGNKQSANHTHTVVDNLRLRLKDTTKEFQEALTIRNDNLKSQTDRRNLFSAQPRARADESAQFLPVRRSRQGSGTLKGSLQSGADDAEASSSEQQSLLQQQQQLMLSAPQDNYLASRNQALHEVESAIRDIGGIFQQLAHMVEEQGELAIRIDENVDETLSNVDSAQDQLLKYLNSISSNRWLIMKIFFVLMLFLVVFVVFVA